jgi:Rrf2 family protein
MFSQTAEYALRAVVHLASCGDRPQTVGQISAGTRVSAPYLSKVLQGLSRAGVVRSQRGLHGGFLLAVHPDELSVYTVLQAVDPICRIDTCPLGIRQHGTNLCPLHKRMDEALAHVEQTFQNSYIGELLREPTSSVPLCPLPLDPPVAR